MCEPCHQLSVVYKRANKRRNPVAESSESEDSDRSTETSHSDWLFGFETMQEPI